MSPGILVNVSVHIRVALESEGYAGREPPGAWIAVSEPFVEQTCVLNDSPPFRRTPPSQVASA